MGGGAPLAQLEYQIRRRVEQALDLPGEDLLFAAGYRGRVVFDDGQVGLDPEFADLPIGENGAKVPVATLVEGYLARLQEQGAGRLDHTALIRLLGDG